MTTYSQTDEVAELRQACESALDDLTASLTQVMKAVNRVHRAVKRLNNYAETGSREPVSAEN